MAQISGQDRALFTATELALIDASSRSEITALRSSRLRSHIARARKLSDKYRGLARAQHRAKKKETGRGTPRAFANVRTERKAHVLAEALTRFEKRLAQLDKQGQKRRPQSKQPTSKVSRRPAQQRETIRRQKQRRQAADESARQSKAARQFQKSQMRAIHGHLRARGRRRQAKRDAR